MLRQCIILLVLISLTSSCSSPKRRPSAFMAMPPQAIPPEAVLQGQQVIFTGDVRRHTLPWIEGMTLAQALLGAQYTGYSDPRAITLARAGTTYEVNVRRLLRGEENPELEPGDVINVRR